MDFLSLFRKILFILGLKYCHISPSVYFSFLKIALPSYDWCANLYIFNAYKLVSMQLGNHYSTYAVSLFITSKFFFYCFCCYSLKNCFQDAFEFWLEIFVLRKTVSNISSDVACQHALIMVSAAEKLWKQWRGPCLILTNRYLSTNELGDAGTLCDTGVPSVIILRKLMSWY